MKKIVEKVIYFDEYDAEYIVECFDGYAIARISDDFTGGDCPRELNLKYPLLADVLNDDDLCDYILNYRGLYHEEKSFIHYGDIMLYLGEIVKEF